MREPPKTSRGQQSPGRGQRPAASALGSIKPRESNRAEALPEPASVAWRRRVMPWIIGLLAVVAFLLLEKIAPR